MANFTNLPERHFVDKARRLSFGDRDSDTYFDGETLEAMLETIQQLQNAHVYRHSIVCDDKDGQYKFGFDWFCDSSEPISFIENIPGADDKKVTASGYFKKSDALYIISYINIDTTHFIITMHGGNLTAVETLNTESGRYMFIDTVTQLI